jgi:HSP20 family protein
MIHPNANQENAGATKTVTEQAAEPTRSSPAYRPVVDIIEKGDELLILADMPGVDPNQIDVQFENKSLIIHGRVAARQDENTGYLLREYGVGDFYRLFQVSEEIDPRQISAQYKDGVLLLHLPKAEAAKPRKIAVNAAG